MRGAFVEEAADLIDPTREEKRPPPFVHLRYVRIDEPYSSGLSLFLIGTYCFLSLHMMIQYKIVTQQSSAPGVKVVRCLEYASRIRIDPDIPQVQTLKQGMLEMDHEEF